MKYSIIIVTYKAEAELRRCIASINQSAITDAEIVIWDNSPESLFWPEPERPWSLRIPLFAYGNGTNYGFAEGCNRGAKMAKGEILIFLNPDTEVWGDWADGMAKYFAWKGPKPIGAVGPISDYVAGLQFYRHHFQELNPNPAATASMAREVLKGRGVATKLLIGFCLMIQRPTWEAIGGMDPQLFLGCDDLDLSMRLREYGMELLIATDVFIHHEGHKSFEAAGTDYSMSLVADTEDRFRSKLLAKYGSADLVPSSEELWGCPIFYTGVLAPMTVSVVMIVRDEENNLIELLPELDFADEVVIVDTKPMEERIDGASIGVWAGYVNRGLRGKIKEGDFPWVDNFAAARNHALSLATGDYVLWLDADDRVPAESAALIRAMLDMPGPLTAQRKCHFGFILEDMAPTGRIIKVAQPRMFPRIEGIYWEHPIHELYGDRALALGLPMVTPTNIIIQHHGYKDPEVMAKKQARNLSLLKMEENGPHKFLHMGNSYMALTDYPQARECYEKLLGLVDVWPGNLDQSLMAHVRYMMAASYYKEFMERLGAWKLAPHHSRGAFPIFPAEIIGYVKDNAKPDSIFMVAEHHFFKGEVDAAEELYRSYASIDITDAFGTNQDTLQDAAVGRIDSIAKMKERARREGILAPGPANG